MAEQEMERMESAQVPNPKEEMDDDNEEVHRVVMTNVDYESLVSDEASVPGKRQSKQEITDIHCDPCESEGQDIIAEGFCLDCNDYLCGECFLVHRKPKPMRHHVLQDRANMPHDKPNSIPPVKSRTCVVHTEQALVYFCKKHDKVLCEICKQMEHRHCAKMGEAVQITKDLLDIEELQHVKNEMISLQQEFRYFKARAIQSNVSLRTSWEEVISELKEVRDSDIQMNDGIHLTCEKMETALESCQEEMDLPDLLDETSQGFIALKQTKAEVEYFNSKLSRVKRDSDFFEYKFKPESIKRAGYSVMIGCIKRCQKEITGIHIPRNNKGGKCYIKGIEILPKNRIVVADQSDNNIKLIDINDKTIISELIMEQKPNCLARIGDDSLAVSSMDGIHIIGVSAEGELAMKQTIEASNNSFGNPDFAYKGVVFTNHILVALCMIRSFHNEQVHGINFWSLGGKELKSISPAYCTPLNNYMEYMALGPDKQTLYIPDNKNNQILIMDLDGKVVKTFQHVNLKALHGIAVGRNGRVFVCSRDTDNHCVLEIFSDLSRADVILDSHNGIVSPSSIMYDEEDGRLYIGGEANEIKVFRV